MARKVKETPILKGKDAERFERTVKKNESKTVPPEDFKRAMEVYKRIKSASDLS